MLNKITDTIPAVKEEVFKRIKDKSFIVGTLLYAGSVVLTGILISFVITVLLWWISTNEIPSFSSFNVKSINVNPIDLYGLSYLVSLIVKANVSLLGTSQIVNVKAYAGIISLLIIPFASHFAARFIIRLKPLEKYNFTGKYSLMFRALLIAILNCILFAVFKKNFVTAEFFESKLSASAGFSIVSGFFNSLLISLLFQLVFEALSGRRIQLPKRLSGFKSSFTIAGKILLKLCVCSVFMALGITVWFLFKDLAGINLIAKLGLIALLLINIVIYIILFVIGGNISQRVFGMELLVTHFINEGQFTNGSMKISISPAMSLLLFILFIAITAYELRAMEKTKYLKRLSITAGLISAFAFVGATISRISMTSNGSNVLGSLVGFINNGLTNNNGNNGVLLSFGVTLFSGIITPFVVVFLTGVCINYFENVHEYFNKLEFLYTFRKIIALTVLVVLSVLFPLSVGAAIEKTEGNSNYNIDFENCVISNYGSGYVLADRNGVYLLDTKELKIKKQFDLDLIFFAAPSNISLDNEGKNYTLLYDDGTIIVFDKKGKKVLEKSGIKDYEWSPGGKYILLLGEEPGIMDVQKNEYKGISVSAEKMSWKSEDTLLYIEESEGKSKLKSYSVKDTRNKEEKLEADEIKFCKEYILLFDKSAQSDKVLNFEIYNRNLKLVNRVKLEGEFTKNISQVLISKDSLYFAVKNDNGEQELFSVKNKKDIDIDDNSMQEKMKLLLSNCNFLNLTDSRQCTFEYLEKDTLLFISNGGSIFSFNLKSAERRNITDILWYVQNKNKVGAN